jgi:homoserine kinase
VTSLHPCAVRVPCSTSNLGAGFDCVGLAFERYLDACYIPDDGPLRVERGGTLRGLHVVDSDDVLVRAFRAELSRRGYSGSVGGALYVSSAIPVGRGLGSSGAAVAAGLYLGAAALGGTLDRDVALGEAVMVEGHPDNAAPALFGGLVSIAMSAAGVPRAMRMTLSPLLTFVFAAPDVEVSTPAARTALPTVVAHAAAVRNLGRLSALLYGLAHADGDALAIGFSDELHVPYRLPLIPGAAAALDAARNAGAYGATISGSGSGLIAVCLSGKEHAVLLAMTAALSRVSPSADGFIVRPDVLGAQPYNITELRTAFGV